MKLQFLTVAAAALMAAPMLHAQATTTVPPTPARAGARSHMGPRMDHAGMMKDLGLTADQQARMKAIHSKYAAQMKSARSASKPDFDAMKTARTRGDTAAMRAAREKMRADMAPAMKLREQEMTEARAILTPDQQKQFDAHRAQMKNRMGARGNRAWMGKRPPRPGLTPKPAVPQQPAGSTN